MNLSKEFFDEAFTDPVTKQPYRIPDTIRQASIQICRSFGIAGTCDPMYIANVIAQNLNLGDGLSNFKQSTLEDTTK